MRLGRLCAGLLVAAAVAACFSGGLTACSSGGQMPDYEEPVDFGVYIMFFDLKPETIQWGESVVATWEAPYATACSIDGGVGEVPTVESVGLELMPHRTTLYTLTCEGQYGPAEWSRTVEVIPQVDMSDATAILVGVADDRTLTSLSATGDVDGDGYDDLLIGAAGQFNLDPGWAYLMYGPVDGVVDLALADATFVGEHVGDRAGWSVAIAGDLNDDGYDDMVIGAPTEDGGGDGETGTVYVVYGPAYGEMSLSEADIKLSSGDALNYYAGDRVARGGDLNGDGYDDLLVGAMSFEGGASEMAGNVLVFFGPMDVSGEALLQEEVDAVYRGESSWDLATRVAGGEDVNGDGFDDLLIGAYGNDRAGADAGAVYLIHGPIGPGSFDLTQTSGTLLGEAEGDWVSFTSVAFAGDVNGDGYEDLLAQSEGSDRGASQAGAAYIVFGPLAGVRNLSEADVIIIGESRDQHVGYMVTPAGDVNGDGYDDILIGAPQDDLGPLEGGSAGLFLGPIVPGVYKYHEADYRFYGEGELDNAGTVLTSGDIDGDGLGDLVIGAEKNDRGGDNAGAVYVIYGGGF